MPNSNILNLLQNDHRKVLKLFKDLEMTTTRGPGRRQDIFCEIDEALTLHADFEERKVYPLMADSKSAKAIVLEAIEEHEQLKRLLVELRDLDPQDERWMAKAQVLMEDVSHHIKEEEGEAFPEIRKRADAELLKQLAKEYQNLLDHGQLQDPMDDSSKTTKPASPERSAGANTTPKQTKQRKSRSKSWDVTDSVKEIDAAGSLRNEDA